jgi:hypothetical protein
MVVMRKTTSPAGSRTPNHPARSLALYNFICIGNGVPISKNKVLRRIFERKRDEVERAGEDCIVRNFITCMLHKMLLG